MIKSKAAIATIFRRIADKIENNTCELDDRELTDIANMLVHRKLNAEQLAHHLEYLVLLLLEWFVMVEYHILVKLLVEINIGGKMKWKIILPNIMLNMARRLQ